MNNQPQQVEITDFSAFLKEAGWGDYVVMPMGADMGLRRYCRLQQGNKTALLMDMSRAGILETGLENYVRIAEYLRAHDIWTPNILYDDLESGISIIEDMGSISFGDAVHRGGNRGDVYTLATDILVKIKDCSESNDLGLNDYVDTLIYKRLGQFVDYYMPRATGRLTTQADHNEFQVVWAEIEKSLPPCPQGFCHADYHLENLMWRPDYSKKYGLIDFQDAFWGFIGYDLLNLLEDARQSVPEDIKVAMKDHYCAGMSIEERAVFDDWYAVLSAHFHFRVIGLFIKFSLENDDDSFLKHIPRLQTYITNNLKNPVLAPLKEFIESHSIALNIAPNLNLELLE